MSSLFCQAKYRSSPIIAKSEIQDSLMPPMPMLRTLVNAVPVLPKPKLSPVPPVLSGPDQARFFVSHASRPRAGLKNRRRDPTTSLRPDNRAMMTTLTPDLLATSDPSKLLLYCQQVSIEPPPKNLTQRSASLNHQHQRPPPLSPTFVVPVANGYVSPKTRRSRGAGRTTSGRFKLGR